MIRAMHRYFSAIPPVFLDGCIAVGIAVLTSFSMNIAQDDASNFLGKEVRFWLILTVGSVTQGLHALSKFRDQTFSRHLAVRADEEVERKKIEKEERDNSR